MPDVLDIQFVPLSAAPAGAVLLLAGQELALGSVARGMDERSKGALTKAARAADFTGKAKTAIEVLAPPGIDAPRLILIGTGRARQGARPAAARRLCLRPDQCPQGRGRHAGGGARRPRRGERGGIRRGPGAGRDAAQLHLQEYRTRKSEEGGEEEAPDGLRKLVVLCAKPDAAAKAFATRKAVADGVFLARDLVNEPANVLGPVEFAERMRELSGAGLEVEVFDEDQMRALKMGSFLAVGQGSERPSRMVVLQWHGAKSKRAKTLCFVGKGVCFDTGGISMKPAGGMEDMKGDMGGAACVAA